MMASERSIQNVKAIFRRVLPLLAVMAIPLIIRSPYHLSVLIMIGIYSIIILGLNLVLGNTGQISLGQTGFYGIGAYCSAIYSVNFGINVWLSMFLAGITAAIFGFMVGFASVRLKGHYLAMATLGFALVISIVLMEWIPVTGGAGGFPEVIPRPSLGSFRFETDVSYYYLVSLVVIFFYYVTENIGGCRIGRALYAISHNELVAETLGVSASKYKLKVFMLSAFYAGIAGGLFAHYITYIAPESFSFYLIIPMLCMVVVGGLCSAKGSILGAGVLMLLPELIRYFSEVRIMPKALQLAFRDHTWHLLSYGVILLLFVLFVPGGLASSLSNLADKFAHWFGLKERSQSPAEL